MNTSALKGYIEETIKYEYMVLETLEKRINNHNNATNIIDYEDLFKTQGKIQAFKEILHIINKSSKKEGE